MEAVNKRFHIWWFNVFDFKVFGAYDIHAGMEKEKAPYLRDLSV
ncbi:MAG: hypothetical protein P8165_11580 [Deltaproteobacteria bacterium]